jgi:tetratricopeptide (TPR) repeat protein
MNTQPVLTKQAGNTSFSQVFGLAKQEIEAIAVLGFQLYEQGKMNDAEAIFNGLIALDNKVYYGYAGLGAMSLAEEKLDESVRWLTRAAELNPKDPTVHTNLGEALLRQGKFREASDYLQLAIAQDPQGLDPGARRARTILSGLQAALRELEHSQPVTA